MGLQKLEIVFDSNGIAAYEACSIVLNLLKKRDLLPPIAELYGEDVASEKLLDEIKQSKQSTFQIEVGAFAFHFASIRVHSHDLLQISQKEPSLLISWDEWVSAFSASPALVQAWVSDIEYCHWQNAEDPLEYEAAGSNISGLPTRSNELPPPLQQTVVDISGNPSRRVIRNGYVEAIGGIMWLAPKFFPRSSGCNTERLKSADWLKVDVRGDGLLRLEVVGGVFQDSSTKMIQKSLRSLLFGQD